MLGHDELCCGSLIGRPATIFGKSLSKDIGPVPLNLKSPPDGHRTVLLQSATSNVKHITVLIVDDDDITRQLLRGILRSAGLQVVGEASDGERALGLYPKMNPHVICLDIDMPGMSGIEVLKKMRADGCNSIVLIVTGAATSENVRSAIAAGANGIIAKPFNTAKIIGEIERTIAKLREKKAAT
jgi:two-component system chemotaxis response regulator CheY